MTSWSRSHHSLIQRGLLQGHLLATLDQGWIVATLVTILVTKVYFSKIFDVLIITCICEHFPLLHPLQYAQGCYTLSLPITMFTISIAVICYDIYFLFY